MISGNSDGIKVLKLLRIMQITVKTNPPPHYLLHKKYVQIWNIQNLNSVTNCVELNLYNFVYASVKG